MDWKNQLQRFKESLPNEKNEPSLKFIDTHAHYDHSMFKNNREELLKGLTTSVSHVINLGTNVPSNLQTLVLVSLHDFIWGMLGFFPTSTYLLDREFCPDADTNLLVFEKQLLNQKIVGIGEIGLDYHWDCIGQKGKEIKGEKAREVQKKWFRKQIDMARERNLPVSMHSRDAEEDTIKLFNEYSSLKGVMHCFSYGMKSAEIYLSKGLYLGIGGTSTYSSNKELREVIKQAPLDRLLLETDAPYLSPQEVRRERNTSHYISYVIKNIAEIKNISEEEVILQTNKNAFQLFGLKEKTQR